MTQPGSSNFEYGPDSVAARLSVDVPPEGIQTLHQLAKEAENLRVQMEALVRAEGDHVGMVQQMSEIHAQVANSTRGLTEEMSRLSNANSGSVGGGGISGTYWGAPAGTYMDPFGGSGGAGLGRMTDAMMGDPRGFMNAAAQRGMDFGAGGGSGESTITQESIAALSQEISNGVREGMQAEMRDQGIGPGSRTRAGGGRDEESPGGRGRPSGGGRDDDNRPDPDRDRTMQLQGLTDTAERLSSRFVNEMGQGGSLTGMGGTLMEAMNSMGGGGGRLGALMGAAGRVGPAGVAIGGALGAYGLMQAGGEMVQGYANTGSIRGGGASEGLAYEMQARSMAINPFISTEQARQVIQGGLSGGYSGKTFDTVTQFVAENLKEMNMSAQESYGLLNKTVNQSGESVDSLAAALTGLKETSKEGVKTFEDLKAQMEFFGGALTSGGMNQGANQAAQGLSSMFKDNKVLQNFMPNMMSAIQNDPSMSYMATVQSMAGKDRPDLLNMMPDAAFAELGADLPKYILKPLQQYFKATGNKNADIQQMMALLQGFGVPADRNTAEALVVQLSNGSDPGMDGFNEAKKGGGVQSRSAGGSIMNAVMDRGNAITNVVSGAGAMLFNPAQGMDWIKKGVNNWKNADFKNNELYNPQLDELVNRYGANGIEILDKNGNAQKLSGGREQLEGLGRGDLMVRQRGSSAAPQTLDQIKQGGGLTDQKIGVKGEVNIKVSSDPGLKVQAPPTIKISSHQESVLAGRGSATMNDPPPGG